MKLNQFVSPRSAKRVVDRPEWYGGGYDLVSGKRTTGGNYSKSPWANACMNIRGSELANLPWRLVKGEKKVESHPIIDMLTNFGKESNYEESVIATEIDMLLTGHGFWLIDVDILERLNASTMSVKSDSNGIKHFIQTIDGKVANKFNREEVIYFREFHPDTDLDAGTPVMETVKLSVDQEYEASLYVKYFFKNDATPSLLLSSDQTISQPEMNKVLGWWNKRFRGRKKAHKVSMADRGLKAQILSTSMRDIALVEIRDQARGDICVGMRVPKILVGAMEEATYANAQEARKFMIEDWCIPRARYFAGVINANWVQKIDPTLTFEFVWSELPILQETATSKWERLDSALQRNVITPEFAREQMGWPESAAPAEKPIDITSELSELDKVQRAWKRKAMKAVKRGQSADVEFETDMIPSSQQLRIHDRLAGAGSEGDVLRAFIDD